MRKIRIGFVLLNLRIFAACDDSRDTRFSSASVRLRRSCPVGQDGILQAKERGHCEAPLSKMVACGDGRLATGPQLHKLPHNLLDFAEQLVELEGEAFEQR